MSELVIIALTLYVPLGLVCGAFLALSHWARNPQVARTLRISAIMWFVSLGAIFAFVITAIGTCQGNMLYGYSNCTVIPTNLANLSLPLFLLGTAAGILYAVIMSLICAISEWRTRHA